MRYESRSSWFAFDATKFKIRATAQAVKAAEVAYEGTVQGEALGSKSIIDVLRAEERLNKARERNVDARKEVIVLSYKVRSFIGELTAKAMNLKVKYFSPEHEFKKAKRRIVGF